MTTEAPADPPMSNEQLDAAISEAASSVSFVDLLAVRGETTVVMGEGGDLVVRRPDGIVDSSTNEDDGKGPTTAPGSEPH